MRLPTSAAPSKSCLPHTCGPSLRACRLAHARQRRRARRRPAACLSSPGSPASAHRASRIGCVPSHAVAAAAVQRVG
eukprot:7182816-Prymnesium_polylepis.1